MPSSKNIRAVINLQIVAGCTLFAFPAFAAASDFSGMAITGAAILLIYLLGASLVLGVGSAGMIVISQRKKRLWLLSIPLTLAWGALIVGTCLYFNRGKPAAVSVLIAFVGVAYWSYAKRKPSA